MSFDAYLSNTLSLKFVSSESISTSSSLFNFLLFFLPDLGEFLKFLFLFFLFFLYSSSPSSLFEFVLLKSCLQAQKDWYLYTFTRAFNAQWIQYLIIMIRRMRVFNRTPSITVTVLDYIFCLTAELNVRSCQITVIVRCITIQLIFNYNYVRKQLSTSLFSD